MWCSCSGVRRAEFVRRGSFAQWGAFPTEVSEMEPSMPSRLDGRASCPSSIATRSCRSTGRSTSTCAKRFWPAPCPSRPAFRPSGDGAAARRQPQHDRARLPRAGRGGADRTAGRLGFSRGRPVARRATRTSRGRPVVGNASALARRRVPQRLRRAGGQTRGGPHLLRARRRTRRTLAASASWPSRSVASRAIRASFFRTAIPKGTSRCAWRSPRA